MRGEQAAKFISDAYKPHEAREPQRLEKHSELWRVFEGVKDDQEKLAFLQKAPHPSGAHKTMDTTGSGRLHADSLPIFQSS